MNLVPGKTAPIGDYRGQNYCRIVGALFAVTSEKRVSLTSTSSSTVAVDLLYFAQDEWGIIVGSIDTSTHLPAKAVTRCNVFVFVLVFVFVFVFVEGRAIR